MANLLGRYANVSGEADKVLALLKARRAQAPAQAQTQAPAQTLASQPDYSLPRVNGQFGDAYNMEKGKTLTYATTSDPVLAAHWKQKWNREHEVFRTVGSHGKVTFKSGGSRRRARNRRRKTRRSRK